MDYTEGSNDGVYNPIRPLFDTPIYQRAQQIYWHPRTYWRQVSLMVEFFRLGRSNHLPPEMTVDDAIDLIKQLEKVTLRGLVRHFELEEYKDEPEILTLLDLVWQITASLKLRDVVFEARRLMNSSVHVKTSAEAKKFAREMAEQWQPPPSSSLLTPNEVVLKLMPAVLLGFWRAIPDIGINTPSQCITNMAVGLTKDVEHQLVRTLTSMDLQADFSRADRNGMVLSIQDTVRRLYHPDVLAEKVNSLAPELLRLIASLTANAILQHFEPQPELIESIGVLEDTENQDSDLDEEEEKEEEEEDDDDEDDDSDACWDIDSDDSGCSLGGDVTDDDDEPPDDWYISNLSWLLVSVDAGELLWSMLRDDTDDKFEFADRVSPSLWNVDGIDYDSSDVSMS